jgi:hypothetical protein
MVRVLQVVPSLSVGSDVMKGLMKEYRSGDRSTMQFDFLFFRWTEQSYEREILSLGGRVFQCPEPGGGNGFYWAIQDFFAHQGKDYSVVHCYPGCAAFLLRHIARKNGAGPVIRHRAALFRESE